MTVMRVLVSSYLFMTGYGHFIFFYKKGDFGLLRILKVLVRLNLLTILLSYTMDATYQSYYFSPLVTLWFFAIYSIMIFRSESNKNDYFLLGKIGVSLALCFLVFQLQGVFQVFVAALSVVTGSVWDAQEWLFRVTLDRYIVVVGMFFAFATLRMQSKYSNMIESGRIPMILLSALGMMWFMWFQLSCKDKVRYLAFISIFIVALV